METHDRSWMYMRLSGRLLRQEFIDGVWGFLAFAQQQQDCQANGEIRCPCSNCKNRRWHTLDTVRGHLYSKGFINGYVQWVCHGESFPELRSSLPQVDVVTNPYRDMVMDAFGHGFDDSNNEEGPNDIEEDPNLEAQQFCEMLKAAEEPLYKGCPMSVLKVAARIINLKREYNLAHRCVDAFVSLVKDVLPERNLMKRTFYDTKKVLRALQLPHQKIDACSAGCMLFWKEDASLEHCRCGRPRYKITSRGKRVPVKVLTYFPIIPRLQRLYSTKNIAELMRWHVENPRVSGKMAHPSDSPAWKQIDDLYTDFASEPRNVRLGLCTDGFAPYGKFGGKYSCWPVILTPYNLPPSMCMKKPFMFLSLLIPGPKNPKGNLDVYMQPLIEDLKQLWEIGVWSYDVSKRQNFLLRAMIIWTVSDFPAYGMLSGYSTAGKCACPYCMERTRAFYLPNGHKVSWFDCSRQFLPQEHPFRKNKTCFFKNRVETNDPPPRLSGCDIWERVSTIPKVTDPDFDLQRVKRQHIVWNKQSILWELPYWRHLLLRHNLDVMHSEKKKIDQLINTLMNVKGRTTDSIGARKDMATYCKRPHLEVVKDSRGEVSIPKAPYALTKEQNKVLCEWLIQLKFLDGYVSDFARCVDQRVFKLSGMKSHDCHVFMKRLIPVAFREFLPPNVWNAITELSQFFRDLCMSTITDDDMLRPERNIPEILCKLEKKFPPAFFNCMEHLPIHLPYEAKVGGPVQYRWMYSFERFLDHLKRKIGNQARVEGSICNAYLAEEISNFCTQYFETTIDTKSRDLGRNVVMDDETEQFDEHVPTLFHHTLGHSSTNGSTRYLEEKEYRCAHHYVLSNCGILADYERMFEDYINAQHPGISTRQMSFEFEKEFANWFQLYVIQHEVIDDVIQALAMGPSRKVKSFHRYYINGFNFHTYNYGKNKSTMSYGVGVRGYDEVDYFGILDEVIEMSYCDHKNAYKTVLFKCTWMDTLKGMNVHKKYKLVEVNHMKKYPRDDPFILAYQAHQVYYATYPSLKKDRQNWWVVFKTKARATVDTPVDKDFFQEEVLEDPPDLSEPIEEGSNLNFDELNEELELECDMELECEEEIENVKELTDEEDDEEDVWETTDDDDDEIDLFSDDDLFSEDDLFNEDDVN